MKKLFTILAIAIFAFSLSINAGAYGVDNGYLDRAVTLLADLEIISQTEDYTQPVTRGDFTNMLVKALGIGNIATSNPIPFTDVASGDNYYDAVQSAYNLGIISKAELFNPSRSISYDEIIKMTVCAAGYTFLADNLGSYPVGHQVAASKLGMLDGIESADCTYATAYVILYNTITTSLPEVNIVDGVLEYSIDSNTNILESVYGLSLIEGRLDGAEFFGGVSGSGVGEGNASIDGVLLGKGDFDTDSMYGAFCSAWYDKSGTIRTIYAEEPARNDVLVLNSGAGVSYKNMTYTYYTDDGMTERSVTINDDCLVVFNGKEAVYSNDIMLPEHGTVKLVRTGKGGYDTVIIDSYTEIVAGGINLEKQFVADALDPSNSVSLRADDYIAFSMYDQNGRAISFSDIIKYDVLWYAKSKDGELLKVMVSKDRFLGEYNGDSDTAISIDGEMYEFSDSREKIMKDDIVKGSIVTVSLNSDGQIAYINSSTSTSDVQIGYLVITRFQSGLSSKILVKLFGQDGKMKLYTMAPKFNVNGVRFESTQASYDLLPKNEGTSSMKSSLVNYALNKNGEIAVINYPDNILEGFSFGATYTNIYKNASIPKDEAEGIVDKYIRYYESFRMIVAGSNNRIFVNSSTYQFVVPRPEDAASAEDDDYSVRQFSGIVSGTYMTNRDHEAYTLTEGSLISNYMVSTYALSQSFGSVSTSGSLYIVRSVSRGLDDEGVEATVLTVDSKSASGQKLYVEDDAFISDNNISAGDVIKVAQNGNKVSGITLVYKSGADTLSNKTDLGSTGYVSIDSNTAMTDNEGMGGIAASYIVLGRIYQREGSFISVLPLNITPSDSIDESKLVKYSLIGIGKIQKYDIDSQQLSDIDIANLNDFKTMGDLCDIVVIESDSGQADAMFVFE